MYVRGIFDEDCIKDDNWQWINGLELLIIPETEQIVVRPNLNFFCFSSVQTFFLSGRKTEWILSLLSSPECRDSVELLDFFFWAAASEKKLFTSHFYYNVYKQKEPSGIRKNFSPSHLICCWLEYRNFWSLTFLSNDLSIY